MPTVQVGDPCSMTTTTITTIYTAGEDLKMGFQDGTISPSQSRSRDRSEKRDGDGQRPTLANGSPMSCTSNSRVELLLIATNRSGQPRLSVECSVRQSAERMGLPRESRAGSIGVMTVGQNLGFGFANDPPLKFLLVCVDQNPTEIWGQIVEASRGPASGSGQGRAGRGAYGAGRTTRLRPFSGDTRLVGRYSRQGDSGV